MSDMIKNVYKMVSKHKDSRIVLMRDPLVINWVFGQLDFLKTFGKRHNKESLKTLEDRWGRSILKKRRPDLLLNKQWTNTFGEHICEEINILMNKKMEKPRKLLNYRPDFERPDCIIEVKTGTYGTSGTAGEKILGCPFKYAEIPELYKKPLLIMCIGGAELICKNQYGNLPGIKCTPEKKRFLEFFKLQGIGFVGASDLLSSLVDW